MTLDPFPDTYFGDRTGGFLMHNGDMKTMSSSDGCIVIDVKLRKFIDSSGNNILRVISYY